MEGYLFLILLILKDIILIQVVLLTAFFLDSSRVHMFLYESKSEIQITCRVTEQQLVEFSPLCIF